MNPILLALLYFITFCQSLHFQSLDRFKEMNTLQNIACKILKHYSLPKNTGERERERVVGSKNENEPSTPRARVVSKLAQTTLIYFSDIWIRSTTLNI